jgi:membrane-bound metal-dependent hydrolase YbcI (DUF457 family)
MPSPVGHILAGLAVGSFANRRTDWMLPLVCGVAAALPDADFLFPIRHRGPSHSVLAAAVTAAATFAVLVIARVKRDRLRIAAAVGLAVLSHVLLDWLGKDSSTPRGVMALWPWTTTYYMSELNIFDAIDRRYWLEGFWRRNTIALMRELVILLPIVWLSTYRSPARSSVPAVRPPPSA